MYPKVLEFLSQTLVIAIRQIRQISVRIGLRVHRRSAKICHAKMNRKMEMKRHIPKIIPGILHVTSYLFEKRNYLDQLRLQLKDTRR